MGKQNKSHWHGKFNEAGLRFTEPRRMILDVLSSTDEHPSAEDLYMRVLENYPNVGLTTVYRNLDLLEKMGIIARFQFGDGRSRYELIQSPQKPGHHHHLVCVNCKKIIDYDDFVNEEIELLREVEAALSDRYGFKITGHVIQFYGQCNRCPGST